MKFIELLATQCRNIFVPIVAQAYPITPRIATKNRSASAERFGISQFPVVFWRCR